MMLWQESLPWAAIPGRFRSGKSRRRAVLAGGVMLVLLQLTVISRTWSADSVPNHAAETGSIAGRVVYTADPARPWRLGRYYINSPGSGNLAEAVVALRGRSLQADPGRKPVTHSMDQLNFQFVPETLAITRGDSVRFTNSDTTTHNVRTEGPLASFNVNMEAGGDHVHTFARDGGVQQPLGIGCIYHGGMRAWIYVFDHPWYHVTGPDGRFEFSDIPAGEYTLEMAHAAGRLRWRQRLAIRPGERTEVEISVTPDDLVP